MSKADRTRQNPAGLFEQRDRNKDGLLSLEEFVGNPASRNVPALTKRFKKLDSNNDDNLQPAELGVQAQ
jgi:Ca2+-binding EF-hand superfamily protein